MPAIATSAITVDNNPVGADQILLIDGSSQLFKKSDIVGGIDKLLWAVRTPVTKTADFNIAAADTHRVYIPNGSNLTGHLPSAAAGLVYHFVRGVTPVAAPADVFVINPVITQTINGEATWRNTSGTAALGDSCTVIGVDDTSWITIFMHGIWGIV